MIVLVGWGRRSEVTEGGTLSSLGICCVSLCCYSKGHQRVVSKMFTSHSSESWKSKIRVAGWVTSGENPLTGCRLPTYCCGLTQLRAETNSRDSYKGTQIAFMRTCLHDLNLCNPVYLSKSLPPNPIHCGDRVLTYNFLGTHSVHDKILNPEYQLQQSGCHFQ